MIAPNTNIRLLKTEIEIDEVNTLDFVSESSKYNYFNSLPKITLEDATYQRKEGVLRYPTTSNITFEDLLEYNYCMYQNESYDNKWFYAFIDDIRYINDGMCEIKLKTDSFMTWQNDIVYKESFIERQHVSDDTIGLHTIPENLETGEYIEKRLTSLEIIQWQGLIGTCNIVLGLSEPPYGASTIPASTTGYNMYGNIYSALTYVTFQSVSDCNLFINDIQSLFSEDIIVTAFMVPQKFLRNIVNYVTPTGKNFQVGYIESYNGTITLDTLSLDKPTSIDGYVPKNKKCLCYPYTYLMISNNTGQSNIYRYEFFNTNNCSFTIDGIMSVGCSIKCIPVNYNNTNEAVGHYIDNYLYSTNMAKLPTCSWNNDAYTNWLTANSVDMYTSLGVGIGSTIGGAALIATGAGSSVGVGLIGGGLGSIYNTLKKDYQTSLIPDSAKGGSNQGDIVFSSNNVLIPSQFTIRREYIKCIDSFFTMYGYKVNSLETINIRKRSKFDYIKTIGCNIAGNIPQTDLNHIKTLFDNGIRIWHDTSHFLDYDVNNTIR